jgi:hypothetical protein
MWRSLRRPSRSGPKYTFQIPSAISSKPTYSPTQTVDTFTYRLFPSNAAVGANVPDFESIGVLERPQPVRMGRGDGA